MDMKLLKHAEDCYRAIAPIVFLHELIQVSETKNSERFFLELNDTILGYEYGVRYLKDFGADKTIEVLNSDKFITKSHVVEVDGIGFQTVYEPPSTCFEILFVKDVKEIYEKKLKDIQDSIYRDSGQMSPEVQIAAVYDALIARKALLGKEVFTFNFGDIPENKRFSINLYFALLYLELEKKISKIEKIACVQEEFPPREKIFGNVINLDPLNPSDVFHELIFTVFIPNPILAGRGYTIDLKNCIIKFDEDLKLENIEFKRGNEAHRLFSAMLKKDGYRISNKEIASEVTINANVGDNLSDYQNNTKKLVGRVRKVLGTKAKASNDIFINEKGYVYLKNLKS